MNILITGSNGFVGSKLMWELASKGNSLVGIDISTHCDSKSHPHTQIGDIRKLHDLYQAETFCKAKLKSGIDIVIHCAAAKHDFGISEEEYYSHNKFGTEVLLDFMRESKIMKLIYFSTVSVFGHPSQRTDEDGEFAPDHPYGASKLAGELACTRWQIENEERELIVLRPTVIYGPDNFANMYKMIDMMHRHPWMMIGKGDYIKSIVSLNNLIDMTLFCISGIHPGVQYYNCVDKPYISVKNLMEIVTQNPAFRMPKLKIPVSLAIGIGKLFDVPAKLFNLDLSINSDRMKKLATATDFASERIRQAGYIQNHTIEEEIRKMTDWYLLRRGEK